MNKNALLLQTDLKNKFKGIFFLDIHKIKIKKNWQWNINLVGKAVVIAFPKI